MAPKSIPVKNHCRVPGPGSELAYWTYFKSEVFIVAEVRRSCPWFRAKLNLWIQLPSVLRVQSFVVFLWQHRLTNALWLRHSSLFFMPIFGVTYFSKEELVLKTFSENENYTKMSGIASSSLYSARKLFWPNLHKRSAKKLYIKTFEEKCGNGKASVFLYIFLNMQFWTV